MHPCRFALLLALACLGMPRLTHGDSTSTSVSSIGQLRHDRKLDVATDFAIELASATQNGESGVMLTFNHGTGGTPIYKIYGMGSFDPVNLNGQTCRSQLGQVQESTPGMTVLETGEATATVIGIDIETASLADVFIQTSGSQSVIQYCVYFALSTADGWDANFVETEIRFVIGQDGGISVDSFGNSIAQPVTKDFVTSFGLSATICNVPSAQGDVVSVCINATDTISSIVSVESFVFTSNDGITQNAFVGGSPQSLTEVAYQDAHSCQFNTMLMADFYTSEGKTVRGEGTCTMAMRRRQLQLRDSVPSGTANDPTSSEEEDVSVSLAFVIGEDKHLLAQTDGETLAQTDGETEGSIPAQSETTASSISLSVVVALLLVISFLGSIVSLVAMIIGIRYGRRGHAKQLNKSKAPETEVDIQDCLPITNRVFV